MKTNRILPAALVGLGLLIGYAAASGRLQLAIGAQADQSAEAKQQPANAQQIEPRRTGNRVGRRVRALNQVGQCTGYRHEEATQHCLHHGR